jgi:OOP family OmpA-OmpF porin
MTRRLSYATWVLAAVLLAGCAAKPPRGGTKVTLLPQEDGTPSAVVVRSANTEQQLSEPYQSALARTGQAPVVQQEGAGQVRASYAPLFSTAPPKPVRFVLYFRTGTTDLTAESKADVGRVMTETLGRAGAEIVLIGHTDTKGTGPSNDALSLRRALLVRDLFIQRDFPAARIEATGRGERDLAVATRDEVDEVRNRRVEILVR